MAITEKRVLEVIAELHAKRGARWSKSNLADELGVTVRTVTNYKNKWQRVADALDESRGRRHDWVESKLLDLIEEGNVAATIFFAKTQMKDRGYVERQEIANALDAAGELIPFKIVDYRATITETEE